jgi:hypothetical protein
MTLAFVLSLSTFAQDVKRVGNTFVEQVDSSKTQRGEAKKTNMTYIDKNGKSYDIYISSKGKAFIKKVSKKTGKEYRQYLPKVTEQLN